MRPLTNERLSQIFSEAADLLEHTEWTQGAYKRVTDEGGVCYCAAGALKAVGEQVLDTTFDYEVEDALADALGAEYDDIIRYNDTPRRRKQTVVKYLRRKAEEYANR